MWWRVSLATGAHAVDWIARATGLLPATIFRTARQLQMAGPDLWPKAKKGGGRGAAHLEEPHLVNLGIALAVADHPITAAPTNVRRFRALMPSSSVLDGTGSHLARTLHGCGAFVAGASLGVSLERLVDLLSGPDVTLREKLLPQAAFAVRFVKDERFPLAEVRFDDVVVQHGTPPDHDPPIQQEAVLSHPVFVTLGDLWQNTQAYRTEMPLSEVLRPIRRRRKSAQAAAFRPDENTAGLRQEHPAAFPNQSRAQHAQLGRRTPESLAACRSEMRRVIVDHSWQQRASGAFAGFSNGTGSGCWTG